MIYFNFWYSLFLFPFFNDDISRFINFLSLFCSAFEKSCKHKFYGIIICSFFFRIEGLKPKITSLCGRVSSLPVDTAKERLCQSEIAKKVAHLMRATMSLEGGDGAAASSRMLAQHLSQLPMPEDYALQELRTLTRNYMMEIIES